MPKTVLVTGATDGIGRLTAHTLAARGHHVLVHGRSPAKVQEVVASLSQHSVRGLVCDLSQLPDVAAFAERVATEHPALDVLINNAGVLDSAVTVVDGLDLRFVVNTLAPYVLARRLVPVLGPQGRVVNVSSAGQAPVHLRALRAAEPMGAFAAYAQSKLALNAWSRHLADTLGPGGPVVVAVNPGSMLGSKMLRDAFGVPGRSVQIGADVLVRAALDPEFAAASGRYFDNDTGRFAPPHAQALDAAHNAELVRVMDEVLAPRLG
jgi:NAD(P)-dependent dehydrogenase (short-subunit alcohol dehydrogenase family)